MSERRWAQIRPRRSRSPAIRVALAVALVATGCVGSVDRDEFERIVRERGGGLSQDLVIEAVDALQDEIDVDPLVVESIVATNETVTISAVNPEFPDEFDRYTYRGGGLDGPDPVDQGFSDITIPDFTLPDLPEGVEIPESVQELLDAQAGAAAPGGAAGTFAVDSVSLDGLNAMIDEAIESTGLREAYADSLTISLTGATLPRVLVNVTNDRRSTSVAFGPRGRRMETA